MSVGDDVLRDLRTLRNQMAATLVKSSRFDVAEDDIETLDQAIEWLACDRIVRRAVRDGLGGRKRSTAGNIITIALMICIIALLILELL